MDRKKIITAAGTTAAVFAILAAGGTSPSDAVSVTWGAARHAALLTAGCWNDGMNLIDLLGKLPAAMNAPFSIHWTEYSARRETPSFQRKNSR